MLRGGVKNTLDPPVCGAPARAAVDPEAAGAAALAGVHAHLHVVVGATVAVAIVDDELW